MAQLAHITDIGYCARALVLLGAEPISSFDEGTAEATVAGHLYPAARDALLAAHPWNFATTRRTLAQLATVPVADFDLAYTLPGDLLRVLSVGEDGRGRGTLDYRIIGNTLETDAIGPVVLTYVARVDEAGFPPFFQTALVARLAAEFCIPITDIASRADYMRRLAEDEFRRARMIDAQSEPAQTFEDFPLIMVRG